MRADNIRRASMWAKALLLHPERRFWLIVGLIALGGGALRLLMHDYFLPWYGHGDEGRIVRGVLGLRGLLPPEIYKAIEGYPPLTLWLHEMAQRLAEAQGRPNATDALLDLRRFFMLFNIAGIYWSALLGRHCGGALAGILVAALWAISHIMLDLPVHALGEALAYPLFILSLLLAVQALEPARRWQLALASLALPPSVSCWNIAWWSPSSRAWQRCSCAPGRTTGRAGDAWRCGPAGVALTAGKSVFSPGCRHHDI